jgi:hypothetical protein
MGGRLVQSSSSKAALAALAAQFISRFIADLRLI